MFWKATDLKRLNYEEGTFIGNRVPVVGGVGIVLRTKDSAAAETRRQTDRSFGDELTATLSYI